jgi:hypothetical protein
MHKVGAPISGRLSDRIVVYWRARRNGVWVPEDRLRVALLGAGVLVPLSVVVFGLSTTYIANRPLGLTIDMLALFANGIGVDFVLTPLSAYSVDILHDRSAEVMAATTCVHACRQQPWSANQCARRCLRGTLVALFVAGIIPSLERFGMVGTHLMVAGATWACFGCVFFFICWVVYAIK